MMPAQPGSAFPGLTISTDERKFEKAMARPLEDPDVLRPWLTHAELGDAANVCRGCCLLPIGRIDRLARVLANQPVPASARFFRRHPLPAPFSVEDLDIAIPLTRNMAAIYAAVIRQITKDHTRKDIL
ncbi:hypothetical protein [Mycobacterium sp.]|uniref:hypothetical protein n=1 Tax=Mycobacterium sp. TaxID=1785 RepID=UPI002B94D3C7|nr:hypothetical protein [Mycobacterium sp.]HME48296.1 hypothetical protein [Mycobacterium sp.]